MGGSTSSINSIEIPIVKVLLFADDVITSSENIANIECNFAPRWNNVAEKKLRRDFCEELNQDQNIFENEKDSGMQLQPTPSAGVANIISDNSYKSTNEKAEVSDIVKDNIVDDRKRKKRISNKEKKMEDKKKPKKMVDIEDKLSTMMKSIKSGYETETSILSDSSSSDESLLESMDEDHVIDYGATHYNSDFSFGDISAEDEKIRTRFKERKQQLRDIIPRRDSGCRKYMMEQEKNVHNQAQNILKWKRIQRQKIINRKKGKKTKESKSSTNDSLNCTLSTENEHPSRTASTTEPDDQVFSVSFLLCLNKLHIINLFSLEEHVLFNLEIQLCQLRSKQLITCWT